MPSASVQKRRPVRREVLLADLVAEDWYRSRYPDCLERSGSALADYVKHGWKEGRQPNPYFDPAFYRAGHEPLDEDQDPLADYLLAGEGAGRQPGPLFDPVWYRKQFDLAPGVSALAHYLARRHTGEVSPSRSFDSRFYLGAYPDVAERGADPCLHFHAGGRLEYRLPRSERELVADSALFDTAFYLFNYEDIRRAGVDPLDHFLGFTNERRKPNLYFDPEFYERLYGRDYAYSTLTHYCLIGEARGNLPSPYFNPGWYRREYGLPDGISPLAHYLANRMSQNHAPVPAFDVAFYKSQARGTLRRDRDAFVHYLSVGALRGWSPAPWFDANAYTQTVMTRDDRAELTAHAHGNPLLHLLLSQVAVG